MGKMLKRKNKRYKPSITKQIKSEITEKVSSGNLDEQQILNLISSYSDKFAFETYATYLKKNPLPSEQIELMLANRIIANQAFQYVSLLPNDSAMARDIESVRKALLLMNDRLWEQASEVLKTIPKSSPFSNLRVFTRIMVAFINNDDETILKASGMVSDKFLLFPVVSGLKKIIDMNTTAKERIELISKLRWLWDGPIAKNDEIIHLVDNISKMQYHLVRKGVEDLAQSIYPQDILAMKVMLIELIFAKSVKQGLGYERCEKMIYNILPKKNADLIIAKVKFLFFESVFLSTGKYLSHIKDEFPDIEDRNIACALILTNTVTIAQQQHMENIYFLDQNEKDGIFLYSNELGIKSDFFIVDILAKAVAHDPKYRKAYECLANIKHDRDDMPDVINLFSVMLKHFPNDPFPRLELGKLFYENRSYRKAEKILYEAYQLAPHDRRVIDVYCLSLVISAHFSINRKKYSIAAVDLQKAAQLNSKKNSILVILKTIVLKLIENSKDFMEIIQDNAKPLSKILYIKLLGLLITELKNQPIDSKTYIINQLTETLKKELTQLDNAPSNDIIELLLPIEKNCSLFLSSCHLAHHFLSLQPKKLLVKLNDNDFIWLIDQIIDKTLFPILMEELRSRLKYKMPENNRIIMQFYYASLMHLTRTSNDWELFRTALNADDATLKKLEAASAKLEAFATGDLWEAFGEFPFDDDESFDMFLESIESLDSLFEE